MSAFEFGFRAGGILFGPFFALVGIRFIYLLATRGYINTLVRDHKVVQLIGACFWIATGVLLALAGYRYDPIIAVVSFACLLLSVAAFRLAESDPS